MLKPGETITHCPHCGKELWDQRLDEKGYPRLDTEWEMTAEGGPATKLTVRFVEPGNRLGREIRGNLEYRTANKGQDYPTEPEKVATNAYATDLETFHKTWGNPDWDKRDKSAMGLIGTGGG